MTQTFTSEPRAVDTTEPLATDTTESRAVETTESHAVGTAESRAVGTTESRAVDATEARADGFLPVGRGASVSRAFVAARDLRAKTLRDRGLRRLVFWALVVGTTLAFVAWGAFVMRPRYAAEARFSVRGAISSPSATSTTSSAASSLLSSGQQPLTSSIGYVDGFAANDFINSRDCMLQLGKRLNLPAMLHVSPAAGVQALYKAYGHAVASRFDMIEQINVITVSAFSPADSRAIADGLLAVTDDFVEREDEVGARNELNVSETELNKAKAVAKQAEDAVGAWRLANHDIDPEAEATMEMTLIGQLEQQLAAAQVNYEKILAFNNPDHPMLRPAKAQVDDLQRQIAASRQRLTGDNGSQAARLRTYTLLKEDEAFEEANLATDQAFWLQALHDVTIMRRFLGVVAQPVAQNTPSSPVLWILALEGLMTGLVLALAASFGLKHFHAEQEKAYNRRRSEAVVAQSSAA